MFSSTTQPTLGSNNVSYVRNHHLGALLDLCPRINRLDLATCYHISDLTVLTDAQTGDETEPGGSETGETRRMALRALNLQGCFRIGNVQVASFGVLSTLEVLDLSYCYAVGDPGLVSLAGTLPLLRWLNLEACRLVGDASMAAVAQFRSMAYLNVGRMPLLTDRGLADLASLDGLEELRLRGCNNCTSYGVAVLLKALPGLHNVLV